MGCFMSKLFSKDVAPSCKYCAVGRLTADGEGVLCEKRGVMLPDSSCRKFRYDPLKRIPLRQSVDTAFTESDFSLEEP